MEQLQATNEVREWVVVVRPCNQVEYGGHLGKNVGFTQDFRQRVTLLAQRNQNLCVENRLGMVQVNYQETMEIRIQTNAAQLL